MTSNRINPASASRHLSVIAELFERIRKAKPLLKKAGFHISITDRPASVEPHGARTIGILVEIMSGPLASATGVTIEQLLSALRERGIEITKVTLSSYLCRGNGTHFKKIRRGVWMLLDKGQEKEPQTTLDAA